MSDAPETPPAPGVRERFPELYGELRQLAERMLRHRAAASLSPTELVHEAFFKLRDEESRRLRNDRSQLGQKPDESFKACFGAACRDVLGEQ
ncbi:MAG: hypothetical protein KDE27_18095, partial [Planctomycetes bacterium]|nr:hypothetical protein [Planctomycetota bacterium]